MVSGVHGLSPFAPLCGAVRGLFGHHRRPERPPVGNEFFSGFDIDRARKTLPHMGVNCLAGRSVVYIARYAIAKGPERPITTGGIAPQTRGDQVLISIIRLLLRAVGD
jgi:hypothetical protein